MQKKLFESSVMESVTKAEGSKFWVARAFADGGAVFTQTEAWKSTAAGESKHILSVPTRIEGKNIGRANETTPEQQAVAEAMALVEKKKDSGYWVKGEGRAEDALPLPMLAMQGTFEANKHHVTYPAAVQPKFDGHRMLFDGKRGWTRKGKLVIPECIAHLRFDTGGVILDGELMLPHDEYGFEAGTSAAKKYDPELSPHLVYEVYDAIIEGETFRERHLRLTQMAKEFPKNVRLAETRIVEGVSGVLEAHGDFRQQGHEGAIVRNLGGAYVLQHRSNDLVKVKEMQDREAVICDVEEGVGKFAGMPTFVLRDEDGRDLGKATPKGSFAQKRALWQNRAKLVGTTWTIQFQGITPDGKLRFPVALRERKDL